MTKLLDHIFIDTETSGTDTATDCAISLAAIRSDGQGKVQASFYERIIPTCPVSPEAAKINGYHPDTWGGISFEKAIRLFNARMVKDREMERVVFVGHFGDFDRLIIKNNCIKNKVDIPLRQRIWIDTVDLCWPYVYTEQIKSLKLVDLCKFFDIEYTNHHDAPSDVKACFDLYWEVMRRYSVSLVVHDAASRRVGGILKAVEGLVTGIKNQ